jgi:flagellar biosynthesis/type III secretory pathway protein FliH
VGGFCTRFNWTIFKGNKMTEDEQFKDLEDRLIAQKVHAYLANAATHAQQFIEEYSAELGIMTLRKAYELGYRHGYTDGEDQLERDALNRHNILTANAKYERNNNIS